MNNLQEEEAHELLPNAGAAPKIQSLRLRKQHQYLLTSKIQHIVHSQRHIQFPSLLAHSLHIYIPEEYPFSEPLFSIDDNSQQQEEGRREGKRMITQVIEEWVPKMRIMEIVQLIAIRIKQMTEMKDRLMEYTLFKVYREIPSFAFWISITVLLRILIALGSYSGCGDYPSLGDFQAHRNWMSITHNRPITQWYVEEGDSPWWRLDYPPIAAYLSWILGFPLRFIQPKALFVQMGYQSPILKAYMRFTVLFVQFLFVYPPVFLLWRRISPPRSQILTLATCAFLINPSSMLIDHGHFQYNCLILGLILGAYYCILQRKYYLCCVAFTVACHSKQMAVYYALAVLSALIGCTIKQNKWRGRIYIVVQLVKYGAIVVGVSLLIWIPWISDSWTTTTTVLYAIFPIHRGLYQLKVPNFWCISDVFMNWEMHFSKPVLAMLCALSCMIFSLPAMVALITNPSPSQTLPLGFFTISMTFFMFSYHVHQKSILLPLLMVGLVAKSYGRWFVSHLTVAGCIAMFHLLKQDKLQLQYFVIMLLYILLSFSYIPLAQCAENGLALQNAQNTQITQITLAQKIHKKIYDNDVIRWLFLLAVALLHICQKVVAPPPSLPYLHNLLFAFFSFCFNSYSLLIANATLIEQIFKSRQNKIKQ